MTPERLAFIKQLADSATPGRWEQCRHIPHIVHESAKCSGPALVTTEFMKDARFIAEARTAVPEMYDEIIRLYAEKEHLESRIDDELLYLSNANDEITRLKAALEKCKEQRNECANAFHDDLGKIIHEVAPKADAELDAILRGEG